MCNPDDEEWEKRFNERNYQIRKAIEEISRDKENYKYLEILRATPLKKWI